MRDAASVLVTLLTVLALGASVTDAAAAAEATTGTIAGSVLALDAANGKVLWHSYGGGNFNSSPITYELDGRQYVLTCVDGTVYAWSLPNS